MDYGDHIMQTESDPKLALRLLHQVLSTPAIMRQSLLAERGRLSVEAVQYLVSKGWDPAKDDPSGSPLYKALHAWNWPLARYLVEAGATLKIYDRAKIMPYVRQAIYEEDFLAIKRLVLNSPEMSDGSS